MLIRITIVQPAGERDALRELTFQTQAASEEAETLVLNSF